MRGSIDFIADSFEVGQYYSFVFAPGGTLDLQVSASYMGSLSSKDPPFVWAALCTTSELNSDILDNFNSGRDLCKAFGPNSTNAQKRCSVSRVLLTGIDGGSNWTLTGASAPVGTTHFVFAGCAEYADDPKNGQPTQQVSASWHAVNAGGEELPANEIPLKTLTVGFGGAWAAALGLFALNLAYARARYAPPADWAAAFGSDPALAAEPQLASPVRPLHYALLVPPALFVVEAFVGSAYWHRMSASGVSDAGLSAGDMVSWDVASAALMCVVLALARGWQVTRLRLTPIEHRAAGGLLALYLVAWASWAYSASFLSLFMLMLSYVCMLRYAFASLSWGMALLAQFRSLAASIRHAAGGAVARGGGSYAGGDDAESYQQQGGAWPANVPERDGAAAPALSPSWLARARAALGVSAPAGAHMQYAALGDSTGEVAHPEPAVVDGGLAAVQFRFLRQFRLLAAAYLSVSLLSELAQDMTSTVSGYLWVGYCFQELAAFALWAYLAHLFRGRADPRESPLFDPRGYLGTSFEGLLPEHRALFVAGAGGGGSYGDTPSHAAAVAYAVSLAAEHDGSRAGATRPGGVVLLHPDDGGVRGPKSGISYAEPVLVPAGSRQQPPGGSPGAAATSGGYSYAALPPP